MVTINTTTKIGAVFLNGSSYPNRTLTAVNVNKTANVFHSALPQQDSEEALIIDLMGTTKVITISGTITGDTDTINAFINSLESLCDGTQDPIILKSSYATNDANSDNSDVPKTWNINVMIGSVQHNWDVPGNKAAYTIQLIVGRGSLS